MTNIVYCMSDISSLMIVVRILLVIVKIFLSVLASHKNHSLEYFQQQNNSRQKFSRLRYSKNKLLHSTKYVRKLTIMSQLAFQEIPI